LCTRKGRFFSFFPNTLRAVSPPFLLFLRHPPLLSPFFINYDFSVSLLPLPRLADRFPATAWPSRQDYFFFLSRPFHSGRPVFLSIPLPPALPIFFFPSPCAPIRSLSLFISYVLAAGGLGAFSPPGYSSFAPPGVGRFRFFSFLPCKTRGRRTICSSLFFFFFFNFL